MTDTRAQEIRLGQAINLATQYAQLSGSVTSPEDVVALAGEALPTFLEFINKTQLKLAFEIQQTTPITAAPSLQPAQMLNGVPPYGSGSMPPPPPPSAGVPPTPVPGAAQGGHSKKDQAWRDYFANPLGYYDNRANKKNPKGPDFKHKQTGEGLWLGGQHPAPDWVLQRLTGSGTESF